MQAVALNSLVDGQIPPQLGISNLDNLKSIMKSLTDALNAFLAGNLALNIVL